MYTKEIWLTLLLVRTSCQCRNHSARLRPKTGYRSGERLFNLLPGFVNYTNGIKFKPKQPKYLKSYLKYCNRIHLGLNGYEKSLIVDNINIWYRKKRCISSYKFYVYCEKYEYYPFGCNNLKPNIA